MPYVVPAAVEPLLATRGAGGSSVAIADVVVPQIAFPRFPISMQRGASKSHLVPASVAAAAPLLPHAVTRLVATRPVATRPAAPVAASAPRRHMVRLPVVNNRYSVEPASSTAQSAEATALDNAPTVVNEVGGSDSGVETIVATSPEEAAAADAASAKAIADAEAAAAAAAAQANSDGITNGGPGRTAGPAVQAAPAPPVPTPPVPSEATPPTGTVTVGPESGATATSADGGATVTIPPGSVETSTAVTVQTTSVTLPADLTPASPGYSVAATDTTAGVSVASFAAPPVISIAVAPETIGLPGIYAIDSANAPVAITSEFDNQAHIVRAPISHPGVYIAAAPTNGAGGTPSADATISGSVLQPDGQTGVGGASVLLNSAVGSVRTVTDAAGSFTAAVPTGAWTVSVDPLANFTPPAPQTVSAGGGDSTISFSVGSPTEALRPDSIPIGAQEVASLRTESTRTFRLSDSDFRTVVYAAPVNYLGLDAKWHVIDSSLVASTQSGYALENAANDFKVRFKDTPDASGTLASVTLATGGAFTFGLVGSAQTAATSSSPNAVGYELSPGVSLHYSLVPDGVKESILLSGPGATNTYTFTLTPQAGAALVASQLVDGSWAFGAPGRPSQFVLERPIVSDAAGTGTLNGIAYNAVAQGPATLGVQQLPDGSFRIDLAVDAAWLADPARLYPILIDPTVIIAPNSRDAIFNINSPNGTGLVGTVLSAGGTTPQESTIQFALGQIPSGNITSATVSLYWLHCLPQSCGGSADLGLYRLTSPWDASSTTSQLTWDTTLLSDVAVSGTGVNTWKDWNVPAATIAAWLSGASANYGFLLRPISGTGQFNFGSAALGVPSQAPKLTISWTGDSSVLYQPSVVHSNGAEVSWGSFPNSTGAQFVRYEIHRSLTPSFTASVSTLVATITDKAVTSYVDTTAAPSANFTYKLVTITNSGTSPSNPSDEITVTTPADGQAVAVFQPELGTAQVTYLNSGAPTTNYGADGLAFAQGGSPILRTLVKYDLRQVAGTAVVLSATLGIYSVGMSAPTGVVEAHALTSAWDESGATWNSRLTGVGWATAGGDFSSALAGSLSPAGGAGHWDSFTLTSLVQGWVSGTTSNYGVLLKLANESTAANDRWLSDDYPYGRSLTPKLTITYADGSHALAPSVSMGAPGPDATIGGSSVALTAAASDDGAVTKVEFYVDGALLSTVTSGPYAATLNATTLSSGNHSLSAKAYDNAGNTSTSAITVSMANSAAPTVGAPTVSGSGASTVVTAVASDDGSVSKVEFYANGMLIGTATGPTYSIVWNTGATLPGSPTFVWAGLSGTSTQTQLGTTATMTLSGNEITDLLRSFALQGDGRAADSSTGVWPGTTNLVTNGGFESGTSGWSALGGVTLSQDATQAKYGTKSLKINATTTGQGALIAVNPVSAATAYSFSLAVYCAAACVSAGTQIEPQWDENIGASYANTKSGAVVSLVSGWNVVSMIATTAASVTSLNAYLKVTANPAAVSVDGVQVEASSFPTPYIETNGATASRGGSNVTASSSVINATQGWVALRIRMDWAPGQRSGMGIDPPRLWSWGDLWNNGLQIYVDTSYTGSIAFTRATSAGSSGAVSVPAWTTAGGIATVIARWDASTIAISVNGGAFTSVANTFIPTIAATINGLGATDPSLGGVYDDTYTLTAKAYDNEGKVTTSSATTYTVSNTAGTKYRIGYSVTAPPRELTTDGTLWPIDVTLTNNGTSTLLASQTVLRYLWISADDVATVFTSANIALGGDIAAGANRTVRINITPPGIPPNIQRARYTLRFDLYDTSNGTYFAAHGDRPLETTAVVNSTTVLELGLERYQQYDGEDLGGGISNEVNLANGNNVVSWTPFDEPGVGLDTVLNLTYNSLENGSTSPVGNNWSLSISSLTPFGAPLDVHPNVSDGLAGRSGAWIGFVDGDGSYHVFTASTAGDGTTYWNEPAGVHLYLRQYSTTDQSRWWALTKPDRTTFFYDVNGFPTAVADGNGNALTFQQTPVAAGEDAYGLTKRPTLVTDAGGRSFAISYYAAADARGPPLVGKVKSISDHLGHTLLFSYYDDGNLMRITQAGGVNPDGSWLASRSVTFTYTTPNATGPAIATLAGRQNPTSAVAQSTKLYSVIDFRGNETSFSYVTTAGATQNRLASRTNRAGAATSYSYNTSTLLTTVAMPASRTWTYGFDSQGRVTSITDPVNSVATTVTWSTDNNVSRVTEPTGQHVDYTYNQNGYLSDTYDELGNHTSLVYQDVAVNANDVSGKWKAGRTIPHISQLISKTDPQGNVAGAPANAYKMAFDYDASGNVLHVTDPLGNITTYTYNANGTTATETLPSNGDGITRTTTYNSYDANGLPTQITDAAGGAARAGYDAAGNLLFLQDPNHGAYAGATPSSYQTQYVYDRFGRLIRSSQPKSTQLTPGLLTWTDTIYDPNDNVLVSMAAHYGAGDSGGAPVTTAVFDTMDRPTLVTGPDSSGGLVQSLTEYDTAGRTVKVTSPNGVLTGNLSKDYATYTSYDLLDRAASVTQYQVDASDNPIADQTRTTYYCYDLAGDLRSVTGPQGAAGFIGCPAVVAPSSYAYTSASDTTKYVYDVAHRPLQTIDALGHTSSSTYDANGSVLSSTDVNGNTSSYIYNARGEQIKLLQPFSSDQYRQAVLNDSPLMYWRLGEAQGAATAADASGHGNTGAYAGGGLGRPGAVDDFDTALDAATGGSVSRPTVSNAGNAFSVELWLKWNGQEGGALVFLNGSFDGINDDGYGILVSSGNQNCSGTGHVVSVFQSGATCNVGGSTYTLQPNVWTQIVLSHSGYGYTLYVNGGIAMQCPDTRTCSGGNGRPQPAPGGNAPGLTRVGGSFAGLVDEVSVYNATLSQAQAQAHYEAAVTSKPLLTSLTEYDALGNVTRQVSPRAYDSSPDKQTFAAYVTAYSYDALNRLIRTSLPAESYSATVIADSPLAYWRLGESAGSTVAIDQMHNRDAYIQRSNTLGAAGAISGDGNTAMGAGGRIDTCGMPLGPGPCVGGNNMVISASPTFAVELWLNWNGSNPGGSHVLISGDATACGGCGGYGLGMNGTLNAWLDHYGAIFTSGISISANSWHDVVFSRSGSDWYNGTWSLYVDGVLKAQRFLGGTDITNVGAQYGPTGGNQNQNSWPGFTAVGGGVFNDVAFPGAIDDVSFYTATLACGTTTIGQSCITGSQIQKHYLTGLGQYNAYQHQAYDANGNLLWVSLPTAQSNPANVAAADKTINQYWDSGAIYSTLAPAAPTIRYDYTAEGWQSSSVPETALASGLLDLSRLQLWRYYPDGKLREHVDQAGLRSTFTYDADGNQLTATAALGTGSAGSAVPITITSSYDQYDQLVKTRQPKNQSTNYWATVYTYDRHGNVTGLVQNQEETAAGAIVTAGRTISYAYDYLNQPTSQTDDFGTPANLNDDERVTFTYTPIGLESGRTLSKANGTGGWITEQQVAETYYANGLLKTLTTTNGGATTLAQHSLVYVTQHGVYLDGNKVSDSFLLHGPDPSSPCYSANCTASWRYDARDRLVQETTGTGITADYALDIYSNQTLITQNGADVRTATYTGLQLTTDTVSGFTTKYLYDPAGNLQCTTTTNWVGSSGPSISGTIDPALITYNIYDTQNRLLGTRKYSSSTLTDSADYTLDALDRTLTQTETHSGTTSRTDFTYLALSRAVAQEQLYNSTGTLTETKAYAYDPAGASLTLTDTPNPGSTTRYSYIFNPQMSVELLIDQASAPKAAYGYTAYGSTNLSLTKTAAGFDPKTNPYRFNDDRFDTGSSTIDMGARRYSASIGRFLQRDSYADALRDLGLSQSWLDNNRYNLEGSNPINFVDSDGHYVGWVPNPDPTHPQQSAPPPWLQQSAPKPPAAPAPKTPTAPPGPSDPTHPPYSPGSSGGTTGGSSGPSPTAPRTSDGSDRQLASADGQQRRPKLTHAEATARITFWQLVVVEGVRVPSFLGTGRVTAKVSTRGHLLKVTVQLRSLTPDVTLKAVAVQVAAAPHGPSFAGGPGYASNTASAIGRLPDGNHDFRLTITVAMTANGSLNFGRQVFPKTVQCRTGSSLACYFVS